MAIPGGSAANLILGVGVGAAAGAALEPAVELERQNAWLTGPVKLPEIGLIAELYAGGKISKLEAQNMANRLGYSNGALDSLTWLTQSRLSWPILLRMWRLAAFNPGFNDAKLATLLDESLAHDRLDWNYHDFLTALKHAELPGIGDIGYAVVRGVIKPTRLTPVPAPTKSTYVNAFPQLDIDPVELANALGYTEQMLELIVGRSGLAMAPVAAARALFLTEGRLAIEALSGFPNKSNFNLNPVMGADDYLTAIAKGDLRTEYGDAVRAQSREILTGGEYAELELRGYLTREQRLALTSQHGMSTGDSDLLYDVKGRGLSLKQAFIAERRGGVFEGSTDGIPDWALWQMQRSNLRPEVYNLEWNTRFSLPSAFVVRALEKDGALSRDEAETIYLWEGWPADLAKKVADHYAPSGSAAADPHVTKAQSKAWTEAQNSYISQEATAADVQPIFTALGVPTAAQTTITSLWDEIRTLRRRQLTPTQIKKALREGITNPATGAPWTHADALAALLARGYDQDDATVLLAE